MRPEATYPAWIDCRPLGLADPDIADFFAKSCRLGLNRGRMFGTPGTGWMRLNFGTSRGILEEVVRRVEVGLASLSS